MPATAGICNSYKQEILSGIHLSSHTYKFALLTSSAVATPSSTTSYTGIAAEVANGSGYATGGATLSGFATSLSANTGVLTFSNPSWPSATITARYGLIYNSSLAGKNAVMILDFGTDQTSTNGTFTITMPVADSVTGLIRIA